MSGKIIDGRTRNHILSLASTGLMPTAIHRRLDSGLGGGELVCLNTVKRVLQRAQSFGHDPPRPPGRRRKLRPEHILFIRRLYEQKNDLYYREIIAHVYRRFGLRISASCLHRALKMIRFLNQKLAIFHGARRSISRNLFQTTITQYMKACPDREAFLSTLISMDEMHRDTRDSNRSRGYGPRGVRPRYFAAHSRGIRWNVFGAMTRAGGMIAFRVTRRNGNAYESCLFPNESRRKNPNWGSGHISNVYCAR